MKRIFSALVAALCVVLSAKAQHTDAHIHGHVIDRNTGEHLPYMVVVIKGTTIGVTTENTGHYMIRNAPEGTFTIEVSAVGYKTQSHEVTIRRGRSYEVNFYEVLRRGVQSVSELINVPGFVNLDFADVTSIMKDAGYAHMGVGSASGADKAQIAAKAAISSPLLETSIAGATGILVSITASPDIGLEDIDLASTMIAEEAHPDANIIWGAAFDPSLEDEMRVTIIATGFDSNRAATAAAPAVEVVEPVAQQPLTEEKDDEPIAEVAPVKKPAEPVDPSLSDNDFNDIMSILKKPKNGGKRF